MKFFKLKTPPFDKIETVIGSNTSFSGHLKCDGNIRIDGLCEDGIVETVGNVLVTAQGRVAAKIIANHVSVAGEVTGAVHARGRLEILGGGRVSGDVRVANFYKDEDGILSGNLLMGDDAAADNDASTAEEEASSVADDEPSSEAGD